MDDQCLVLSGEWVCGDGGKWDFIIEKHRMGCMVPVYEGIGCVDLERNVLREFVVDEARFGVALSYWPPTSLEIATGIRTPPVLITNDGTVKYFCKHLKVTGGMNLFAQFKEKPKIVDSDVVDDTDMGFVSPDAAKFSSGSSKRGCIPSAASVTKVINLEEDDDLVREVERVEEHLMSGKRVRGESSCGVEDSGLSSGANSEGDVVLDEIELRPRGYDQEFWDPLLAGDYGGSNAVNVVFNEDEIVEGLKKNSGPRTYVEVGGSSGGDKKENPLKPEDYNPWMGGGVINPDEDPRNVDIPEEVSKMVVYPPITKRQPGRRRKSRIPSTGEIKVPKKKLSQNKCGRCRGIGHNRPNCACPI
ncbi:hypothetical protein HID58_034064 [Brassica napus]|uniref:Uncharacterized protein n=2 Tax=Brassica TaxID=3705 RepID=A0ABQ8C191_BRANA|nr:hypothetical protein HID58_034064 [Brassica napus]